MSDFISDVLSALDESPFEEIPVDVRTFVESRDYLGQPGLSDTQYEIVENMSQIYRVEDLSLFMDNAKDYYRKYTKRELILALGKGCHAPDTPIFDPVSGTLIPLHKGTNSMVETMSGPELAEEPFCEGTGKMYLVTTENNYTESVYLGHKYYTREGWKEVRDLGPGDEILMRFGSEVISPLPMDHDLAELYGIIAVYGRGIFSGSATIVMPDTFTKIPERVRELCKKYNNKLIQEKKFGDIRLKILAGPLLERYGVSFSITPKVWRYDREAMRRFIGGVFYESDTIYCDFKLSKILRHLSLRANRIAIQSRVPHGFSLTLGPEVPDDHWEPIRSIDYLSEGKYWTRTVPGSGNYVGDGFVSSNSGKDYMSTIGVAYIVYKLLCLSDPAEYYGKPPGDAIDIMNIAINAQQAKNVFFKGFKSKIERSPWFKGKFSSRMDYIEFDKGVTVYSGHSERESHEGLNLFCAVLDEISGFVHESESSTQRSKSADAIYKAFRGTVDSRFADVGKVILLSFPRHKNDYISHKYDQAISDKESKIVSYEFKIRDDMPDGLEGNHFTIEWEEDHILTYAFPGIFALKRTTWDVNPTRKIDDFKHAFYTDPIDALQRFACMPPDALSGYFNDKAKIVESFSNKPIIVEGESFPSWFRPDTEFNYFMHVDLAQKHDRCAIAVSHVDSWVQVPYITGAEYYAPYVTVDFIYWWTPSKNNSVDFKDVREFIIRSHRLGFNYNLVTFDRWNSHEMMNELRSIGIPSETLSVGRKHYDEFKLALMESRVSGPNIELLHDELMQLRLVKDKVDHPRSGHNDLSDATCGSIYNAITLTPYQDSAIVNVRDLSDIKRTQQALTPAGGVEPPRKMPNDLSDYLDRMRAL